jgi:hypothetical protein
VGVKHRDRRGADQCRVGGTSAVIRSGRIWYLTLSTGRISVCSVSPNRRICRSKLHQLSPIALPRAAAAAAVVVVVVVIVVVKTVVVPVVVAPVVAARPAFAYVSVSQLSHFRVRVEMTTTRSPCERDSGPC